MSLRSRTPIAAAGLLAFLVLAGQTVISSSQNPPAGPGTDAAEQAQKPIQVPATHPEQQKTPHDTSDVFSGPNARPSSPVFDTQPDKGQGQGFDFSRDPFNAKRPMQTFDEIMKADIADKTRVTD